MAYQMVATSVTLNDLEGHSPLADVSRSRCLTRNHGFTCKMKHWNYFKIVSK